MHTNPLSHEGQQLAAAVLNVINAGDSPRGVALSALSYCRNHFENRTLVETAILVAGCSTSGFSWNEHMELYYDIAKDGEEVAFISKGWNDPGFRLGEMLFVCGETTDQLDEVKKFCDTNGVVMSWEKNDESGFDVVLEHVIYSTGFDGRTFSQALSTLIECSDKLKHS